MIRRFLWAQAFDKAESEFDELVAQIFGQQFNKLFHWKVREEAY